MNPPPPPPPNPPHPQNNQNHACAACRYQRRKCNRDCPFAPYFPPESQTKFLNAHKLFGVGNILKIIKSLPDQTERDTAMKTIIFQSDLRAFDPVFGSLGFIIDLQTSIQKYQNELNLVLHQLHHFRSAAANHHPHHQSNNINHQINFVDDYIHNHHLPQEDYHHQQQHQQQQQEEQGGGGYDGGINILDQVVQDGSSNFGDLNNQQEWRLVHDQNGNGMNNMMMMMMKQEEEEEENALVAVFGERRFFDDLDRSKEITSIGCSSLNGTNPEDSIVQNQEKLTREEGDNSIVINEEDTNNSIKHAQENY